jgi:hypothetical protein
VRGVRFGMIWVFLQSKSLAPVLLVTLSLPQIAEENLCAFLRLLETNGSMS